MASIAELFQAGLSFHTSGNLRQAEQNYRQVLEADPRHADAMHLLGLIALQVGNPQAAVQFISAAIRVDGGQAMFHAHLAQAHRKLGQPDEAIASYRQALRINPDDATLHNELGILFHAQANLIDAEASFREAIRANPQFAHAHNNLGTLYQNRKEHDEALACYREALQWDPRSVDAYNNLGALFKEQGRREESLNCCRTALSIQPDLPQTHFRLALLLNEQQDLPAAAAEYREALRLKPDYPEALVNYGFLMQGQGQLDEALECYDRALRLDPGIADAHFHRANLHRLKRMRRDAVAGYLEAVRLQPNFAAAFHNLAVVSNELQQPEAALEYCQKGLRLEPTSASLHGNMAIALQALARGDEAIACYRKAIELQPDHPMWHSNLLYALNFIPGFDPPTVFAEHLAWSQRYAEPLTANAPPTANDRAPDRRLRIGYFSPHFRRHAVNYFIEPLLMAHDHEQFEIFCYSAVPVPDDVTTRLKTAVDQWRDVDKLSDDQIAKIVREDRIDILVDLAGHIGENRLLVFARKPAPIQVTYIGYQNTTGMSAMDYRLTDARADPPGLTEAFYTEQLVRLPRSFFCYQPPAVVPPIAPLPAQDAGHVTFGAFNSLAKITSQAITAWLQVLARVPSSRLLMLARRGAYLERLVHELAERQRIDPSRVVLCDRRPLLEYLQLLQKADIGLDPFPVNGHTTTCDSIWMGVPVVMLEGETYAARFGGSVLANVGLEHLITRSVEQYVDVAVELAGDLDGLARLRSELRPRMAESALLDFQGFTHNVEQAYRQMWLKWCGSSTKKIG